MNECNDSLTKKQLVDICKEKGIKGYSRLTKKDLVKLCCTGGDKEKCFIPDNKFEEGMEGIPARVNNPLLTIPEPPSMPEIYKRKLHATRDETNDFLRNLGYKWKKEEIYVDGGMASQYWELERYDGDFASVWALKKPDGSTLCYGYDPLCNQEYKKILVDNGFYGDEAIDYENQMGEYHAAKKEFKRDLLDRVNEIKSYFYREKDSITRPSEMDPFPTNCLHPEPNNPFNIYGGGREFVASNKGIWDIQNNGMDGDDWSWNNYPTGGAGAVARKYPLDGRIKDLVLSLPME